MTSNERVVFKRNARLDPRAIADLFTRVGWSDEAAVPAENIDLAFNDRAVTASAWQSDQLIGFVRGKIDGIYVLLTNLVVDPRHQGRGIGPTLFGMAVEDANQVPGVFAVIGLGATEQVPFYERFGLCEVPAVTVISNKPNL